MQNSKQLSPHLIHLTGVQTSLNPRGSLVPWEINQSQQNTVSLQLIYNNKEPTFTDCAVLYYRIKIYQRWRQKETVKGEQLHFLIMGAKLGCFFYTCPFYVLWPLNEIKLNVLKWGQNKPFQNISQVTRLMSELLTFYVSVSQPYGATAHISH